MNPNAGPPPEFWAGFIVCLGIFFVVLIGIQILFLLNLHKTLKAVAERNREMSPGMVWLTLIPLFGNVWAILMVPKIANSLEREFEDRGLRTADEGFGRTAGMIWAWGGIASIVLSIVQNILQFADMMPLAMVVSVLSLPVSIGLLVCWILYWVQTYQYRKRLETGGRGYQSDTEADYDDRYDRPDRRGDGDRPRDRDDDFDRDRPRRDDDRPRRRDDD